MISSSARSILVNLSSEKNLTSNGCKPIRVLTRTKSWTSADHLPIGYLLNDFQLHRSNFFAPPPPPPPPTQPGRKGVDTGETVPIGLLCRFPLLEITAYIHVRVARSPLGASVDPLPSWLGPAAAGAAKKLL